MTNKGCGPKTGLLAKAIIELKEVYLSYTNLNSEQ